MLFINGWVLSPSQMAYLEALNKGKRVDWPSINDDIKCIEEDSDNVM
jgi:hypothetical protein